MRNIDKTLIGAAGGSAGGCSSLWLAYHEDLANPTSEDPIARESTKLWCVAPFNAQTTLDPKQMKEWTPNSRYGGHAYSAGALRLLAKPRKTPPTPQTLALNSKNVVENSGLYVRLFILALLM